MSQEERVTNETNFQGSVTAGAIHTGSGTVTINNHPSPQPSISSDVVEQLKILRDLLQLAKTAGLGDEPYDRIKEGIKPLEEQLHKNPSSSQGLSLAQKLESTVSTIPVAILGSTVANNLQPLIDHMKQTISTLIEIIQKLGAQ